MARDSKKRYHFLFVAPVVLLVLLGEVVKCDPKSGENEVNKDLLLTYNEKSKLDTFRRRVSGRLPQSYMKEDMYLTRWLRSNHFNMQRAEEALMRNLKWRKENRMDTILDEDFSDVHVDYPAYIDTFTKSGRPVMNAVAGTWDLRQGFLTGRNRRTMRYVHQNLERAAFMVREQQKKGLQVTRYDIILSLDGFNLIQHGCPRCLIDIIDVIIFGTSYYPEMYDKITVINTPNYIRTMFEPLIRAAISQSSIDSINFRLFGTDRDEFRRYFLQYMDEKELPEELGGLRVRVEE